LVIEKAKLLKMKRAVLSIVVSLLVIGAIYVSVAKADSFKVIAEGSTYTGGEGWYAGYTLISKSGTYNLDISVTGNKFPITNVKVMPLSAKKQRNQV
jgi:hypothetical protein